MRVLTNAALSSNFANVNALITLAMKFTATLFFASILSLSVLSCNKAEEWRKTTPESPETDPDEPALAEGMKRFYLRVDAAGDRDAFFACDWETRSVVINGKAYEPRYNPARKAWYADAEVSSFNVYSAELTGAESSRWYAGGPAAPVSIPAVQFIHQSADLKDLPLMAEYNPDFGDFLDFRPPYAVLDLQISGMEDIVSLQLTSQSPLCGTASWSRASRSWSFEGQGGTMVLNCTEASDPAHYPLAVFGNNLSSVSLRVCDAHHKMAAVSLGDISLEPGDVCRKSVSFAPDSELLWFEGFDRCVWGGDVVAGHPGRAPSASVPSLDGSNTLTGYEYALTQVPAATPGSGFVSRQQLPVQDQHQMTDSYVRSRGFNDHRWMLRCREYPGYISVGTGDGNRGWFSLYPLKQYGFRTLKNLEVKFQLCLDAAIRDEVAFLVQGTTCVMTEWYLDGEKGSPDCLSQKGASDTLLLSSALLGKGQWRTVRVRIDNCTDLTMLQWLALSSDDGAHGFYLDEIEIREIPGSWDARRGIRLLYWNIQNGMWGGQGDDYDRFVAFVQKYAPDICVFCEAESRLKTDSDAKWEEATRYLPSHWGELAARYGHNYYKVSRNDDFPQVVTSRYPVTLLQQLGGSALKHGAGIYQVETPRGKVYPLALHLRPNDSDGTSRETERRDEMAYILANSVLKPSLGISGWILLGDYNATSRLDAPFYTKDEGYLVSDYISGNTSLKDVFGSRYPGCFLYTNAGKRRIDYIYMDATAYGRVVDAAVVLESDTEPASTAFSNFYKPSDHLPLLVDMQF